MTVAKNAKPIISQRKRDNFSVLAPTDAVGELTRVDPSSRVFIARARIGLPALSGPRHSQLVPLSSIESNPMSAASQPATRVRFRVVALIIVLGMITYLDRACISTLAPVISKELSLSKVQMGYVFSAFALAYAIFEIPTGWFADRHGTRSVLARIVVWWSLFTAATGFAFGYVSLLVTRFLFGMGEAGAWPCVARTFSRWIPQSERGRVQGIFFAAVHLAGGLTPLIVAQMITVMSWRAVFVCFGGIGLVWAAVWYSWFRNEPAEDRGVNPAELAKITSDRGPVEHHGEHGVPWARLFGSRNILAICVMYFPNSFVIYFCITWLPTYLTEQHGFTATRLALLTALPLFSSVIGDLCGGVIMDAVTKRLGLRAGRCGVGAVSYGIACVALLLVPFMSHPLVAVGLIALATMATMFCLPAAWAICIDIGRDNAAVVGATMNTAGQVGSLLCPLVVAYTLKWFSNWNVSIFTMAFLFLAGAIAWCVIDPQRRLVAAPADSTR
jgi:sugar phosphate permease